MGKTGKPTGEYQSKVFWKTVYDPSKVPNEQMLQWGREAAAAAQSDGPLGRVWEGQTPGGPDMMGYSENGVVRSFHPQ